MGEDSVDVVLLTKDSERILRPCLDSIYGNVPVNQLIVVDGYSKDQTLQILNEYNVKYHNVKILMDDGNRATARQKGIDYVRAKWFIFVDSDVVLCQDWYNRAKQYIKQDVGAIWGIEIWSTVTNPKTLRLFLTVTRKIFEVRGGTHDTLIRTSTIKDIRIPADLHVFEDSYIKEYIEEKGYQVVACYSPFCIHYRPTQVWTLRGSLALISEAFKYGSPSLISKLFLAYGFYTLYSLYQILSS